MPYISSDRSRKLIKSLHIKTQKPSWKANAIKPRKRITSWETREEYEVGFSATPWKGEYLYELSFLFTYASEMILLQKIAAMKEIKGGGGNLIEILKLGRILFVLCFTPNWLPRNSDGSTETAIAAQRIKQCYWSLLPCQVMRWFHPFSGLLLLSLL
jgi:hypothetical protein